MSGGTRFYKQYSAGRCICQLPCAFLRTASRLFDPLSGAVCRSCSPLRHGKAAAFSPLSLAALRASRQVWLPLAIFASPVAAGLQIWTAAPAPPRLFRPQDAPRLRSPAGGAKCQPVVIRVGCGKAKLRKTSPYHKLLAEERTCTCLSLRERWHVAPAT